MEYMRMKRAWVIAIGVVLLCGATGVVRANPIQITFDQLVDGGSVNYDGNGGALIGMDIRFDITVTFMTPLHADETLTIDNGLLNFTTGANITEGPVYTWLSGGSFTLTGTIMDPLHQEIASGVLLQGSFGDSVFALHSPIANRLTVNGFGTDMKHPDLLDYLGIPPDAQFTFANTEISGQGNIEPNGGFRLGVVEADLVNTTEFVPLPTAFWMGGALLAACGCVARIRTAKRRAA
jgi:hypothetical protein